MGGYCASCLCWWVRFVIAVFVRNEHQVWSRPDPHAAEADFQAAHQVQTFDEYRSLVEISVKVRVFQDDNLVFALAVFSSIRIRVGFGQPHASAIIKGERDWLMHHRFAGRELNLEPGRNRHVLRGFFGAQT